MPLATAVRTRTRPTQRITLQRRGGGLVDLTGVTAIAGTIRPKIGAQVVRAVAGTLAVAGAPTLGQIDWTYAAGDVVEAGYFWVQISLTFTDGRVESSFIAGWEVANLQ